MAVTTAVFFGLGAYLAASSTKNQEIALIRNHLEQDASIYALKWHQEVHTIGATAGLVAHFSLSEQALTGGLSAQERHQFDAYADAYFLSDSRATQLRLLGVNGQEVLRYDRTNDGASRVAPENLQDESGRGYFAELVELKSGETYVSQLDLNVENGVIDRPFVPTVRVGEAVRGPAGQLLGYALINFDLSAVFENLFIEGDPGIAYRIVDGEGQYLLHEDKAMTWSSVLKDRQVQSMPYADADLWRLLASDEKGSRLDSSGLMAFHWTGSDRDSAGVRTSSEHSVAVLTYADPEYLNAQAGRFTPIIVTAATLTAFTVWVLLGFVYFLNLNHKRESKKAKEKARLMETILGLVGNACLVVRRDGSLEMVNQKGYELLGLARGDIVDLEQTFGFVPDEKSDKSRLRQVLDNESEVNKSIVRRARPEGPQIVELTVRPLERSEGRVESLLVMLENVTDEWIDRQTAEEQIVEMAEQRIQIELEKVQLAEEKEKLSRDAHTDHLTNLPNRRGLQYAFEAVRPDERLSAIMLDIDHFKAINDTYGHGLGDTVLERVSELLKQNSTARSFAARVGGEEFVVLCPGMSLEQTTAYAEQIRKAVEEARVESDAGEELDFTSSFGVAERTSVEWVDDLLARADAALYRSKREGRNRVTAAQPPADAA